jgi:hypothetical protein
MMNDYTGWSPEPSISELGFPHNKMWHRAPKDVLVGCNTPDSMSIHTHRKLILNWFKENGIEGGIYVTKWDQRRTLWAIPNEQHRMLFALKWCNTNG